MHKNGLQLTIISALVILLAVLSAAGLAAMAPGESLPAGPAGERPRGTVGTGRLPGYESQPDNDNPNAFYYTVGSRIVFDRPAALGKVMLENIPGNQYDMEVQLQLEETGEIVYTSPVLQPGQYLEQDSLDERLEKGEYHALAILIALDPQTGEPVTQFTESITLVVKNKLF